MPTLHVNYVNAVNAIAVAPPGFGAFGGQIVGVTTAGTVVAVNPANNVQTTIGTTSGILSDLVFSTNGTTLYIANNTNNNIQAMTSAGVFSQFIGGLSQPDGIAMDSDGSRMIVAHYPSGGRLDRVSIPGAVLTAGVAANIDGGYYTTGVIMDGSDNVFYRLYDPGSVMRSFKAP